MLNQNKRKFSVEKIHDFEKPFVVDFMSEQQSNLMKKRLILRRAALACGQNDAFKKKISIMMSDENKENNNISANSL